MASTAPTERPLPERRPSMARERKPSMSAPLSELQGPVGPDFTRPKHKRTVTGFGPSEIKAVEASIPEPQRAALVVSKLP
jgi:starch phosphorylase